MCNLEKRYPRHYYELAISINKVSYDPGSEDTLDIVDRISLEWDQDLTSISTAIFVMLDGITSVASDYIADLSEDDPIEHSDRDAISGLVRAFTTFANRNGISLE